MSDDGKSPKKHSSLFIRDSKTAPQRRNKSGGSRSRYVFSHLPRDNMDSLIVQV